ncbi:MAG TPA: glutathione S-transferase family protein [Polyangia bacterium]|nr:glutathione S-transferase family protein [Polyangia bacterium]
MILIGQYDSPFVRRVGIALTEMGLPFEHRAWSVWRDAEKIAAYNPLRRVPTLLLDDGTSLIESGAILDAVDEMAPPERSLLPRAGAVRRDGLRIVSLATGTADKGVSLLYEPLHHDHPSERWMARCRTQIGDGLQALEDDRARRATGWWLGGTLSHADIAVACMLRFVREAHPALFDEARYPRLAAHATRCEARPSFVAIGQPIVNNL